MKAWAGMIPMIFMGILAGTAYGENPKEFRAIRNGNVVVQNDNQSVVYCGLEWAPSIHGPWYAAAQSLGAVAVPTNSETEIEIPKFYRVKCLGATNVVAHYSFEGDFLDQSPYGNDPDVIVGATLVTDTNAPARNGVARFDGNDRVEIPSSDLFSFGQTNSFTVSIWFRVSDQNFSANGILLSRHRTTSGESGVFSYDVVFGAEVGSMNLQLSSSSQGVISTSVRIPNTQYGYWHHFVGTYDQGIIRSYLNGLMIEEHVDPLSPSSVATGKLVLGCRSISGSQTYYYQGDMDDVMVFNKALAPDEVRILHEAQVGQLTLADESP